MGRDFDAADNQPGAEKVALIGYGIWQRDFGGAEDTVGRVVRINGKPATIIGVMPQGFAFPMNEELWIPLYSEFPPRPRNDPAAFSAAVLGLLKPGVSLDQATREFTSLAKRFAEAYPDTNKQFNTGRVQPLIETFTPRPLRGTLLTMLGFCVGVLLIACVNVMNMQFARATLRARSWRFDPRSAPPAAGSSGRCSPKACWSRASARRSASRWRMARPTGSRRPSATSTIRRRPGSRSTSTPVVLAVTVVATIGAAVVSGLLPAVAASRACAARKCSATAGAATRAIA